MNNIKETIRQEIDTRRQHMVEELMGHEENCEYHRIKGMHDAYVDLLTFLDYSLPEEKPSEDLEEAAKEYMKKARKHLFDDSPIGRADDAFIAGAEWQKMEAGRGYDSRDLYEAYEQGRFEQKEQMMKEAVEGVVYRYESYQKIATAIIVDIPREILGNKVKIIIVKK